MWSFSSTNYKCVSICNDANIHVRSPGPIIANTVYSGLRMVAHRFIQTFLEHSVKVSTLIVSEVPSF